MTIGFIGSAGTGKTHRLVNATRQFVSKRGLQSYQKVLGLTFMHGSRIRMAERLAILKLEGIPSQVETLDTFALHLVRRCRRYCGLEAGELHAVVDGKAAFEGWQEERGIWRAMLPTIRAEATRLLALPSVQTALRMSFPLILIDEAQDCDPSLLNLVEALAGATQLVCAADPFQDLKRDDETSPLVEWLTSIGDVRQLHQQHRTTAQRLLNTANALREGVRCQPGIRVIGVDAAALAAYEIQSRIANRWSGQLALISPAGPETSVFVRKTLEYLHTPKGKKRKIQPAPFQWEGTDKSEMDKLVRSVCGDFEEGSVLQLEELSSRRDAHEKGSGTRRAYDLVLRRLYLTGGTSATTLELKEAAQRVARSRRRRRHTGSRPFRRAMTIHGAKNREFDYVFVLWPRTVKGSPVTLRKLLYNAVTRARSDAVIIVEGGKSRVESDPLLKLIAERDPA